MKTRFLAAFCTLAASAGALFSVDVGAAPISFQITVPNASGSNNGVPFTKQTVAITVQADTSQVTPVASIGGSGHAGNCVPAISTSISVGGGQPLQATAPMYFCATLDAFITGVFTTPDAAMLSWYFIADYSNAGITNFALASNFPLTSNVSGDTGGTTSPLSLVGGGTASILPPVPPNGTTLAATLGNVVVPTLSQCALLVLATLLAVAGVAAFRRRTRV